VSSVSRRTRLGEAPSRSRTGWVERHRPHICIMNICAGQHSLPTTATSALRASNYPK
jgi:hypothetical protein